MYMYVYVYVCVLGGGVSQCACNTLIIRVYLILTVCLILSAVSSAIYWDHDSMEGPTALWTTRY